jgi:hypothetical protein
MDSGKIISYSRFADNSCIIINKNSLRSFLKDINSFDQKLKFTVNEMNPNNELIYLDMKIFLENDKIHFIKHRKEGILNVISNNHHSIMSKNI